MIKLISNDEKFIYENDGSKFHYKRINSQQASQLRRKNTNSRGILDSDTFGKELLENYIIGWDGVLGEDRKPIDFKPEYIDLLPAPILIDLIGRINGEDTNDEELTGENLKKKL